MWRITNMCDDVYQYKNILYVRLTAFERARKGVTAALASAAPAAVVPGAAVAAAAGFFFFFFFTGKPPTCIKQTK